MAKGMRTKTYSIKKTKSGYTITFKDADYFKPGVVEIPLHLLEDVRGRDIENVLFDWTTSYYAGQIAKAILRHAGKIAA